MPHYHVWQHEQKVMVGDHGQGLMQRPPCPSPASGCSSGVSPTADRLAPLTNKHTQLSWYGSRTACSKPASYYQMSWLICINQSPACSCILLHVHTVTQPVKQLHKICLKYQEKQKQKTPPESSVWSASFIGSHWVEGNIRYKHRPHWHTKTSRSAFTKYS